jgi:hypothetical protein
VSFNRILKFKLQAAEGEGAVVADSLEVFRGQSEVSPSQEHFILFMLEDIGTALEIV